MYFEPRLSLLSAASAQTISRILSPQGTRGTIILFNEGLTILFPTCRQAAAEFCPQLVPGHTQRDCAKSFQTMFPVAPPSLSMVLKPWRNELRACGNFFCGLSSHAQCQPTNPLPAHNSLQQNQPFSQTPKQGQFHVPKLVVPLGASSV